MLFLRGDFLQKTVADQIYSPFLMVLYRDEEQFYDSGNYSIYLTIHFPIKKNNRVLFNALKFWKL